MLAARGVLLVCLSLVACASKESPAPSADTMNPEAPTEPDACEGLLLPDDLSLRYTGQGSHAAAAADITLDLSTGKMTGSDYKLDADGNTPVPLTVDQQVSPAALAALRERFEATCAPRRKITGPEHAAPGGSSMFEVKHADGSSLFVIIGASNLPAGAMAAEVAREDWQGLFERWPATEGK